MHSRLHHRSRLPASNCRWDELPLLPGRGSDDLGPDCEILGDNEERRQRPAPCSSRLPVSLGESGSTVAGDNGEHESVVSFGADGLNRRRAHPWLARQLSKKRRIPWTFWSSLAWFGDLPATHDVVDDDQAPDVRQLQRPGEVLRRGRLVGVDEDEVEAALGPGPRASGESRAAGPTMISTTSDSPARAMFASATAAWRGSASRVTSSSARRQAPGRARSCCSRRGSRSRGSVRRPAGQREQVQQLALVGRHVDRGKARVLAGPQRRLERGVRGHEKSVEVAVDVCPVAVGSWSRRSRRLEPAPGGAEATWLVSRRRLVPATLVTATAQTGHWTLTNRWPDCLL